MPLATVKRPATRPRKTMLYGVHGIGKSTFGASAPNPVFIQTEDGIGDIDVDRFPLCETHAEFIEQLGQVINEDHDRQTLVVDSADWLEQLIHGSICQKCHKDAITEFDYGKGYGLATAEWKTILDGLTHVIARGMSVVILTHSQIEKFSDPAGASYDRYSPKLHKASSALLQEWCDEVLFATSKVYTREEDEGFGKKRTIGLGGIERVIKTTEAPSHIAKNRLSMPPEIAFSWQAYASYFKKPA